MGREPVTLEDLASIAVHAGLSYRQIRRDFDRAFIVEVLNECGWNQCKAARQLGMHRNTLNRKIYELKIVRPARAPRKPPAPYVRVDWRERAS